MCIQAPTAHDRLYFYRIILKTKVLCTIVLRKMVYLCIQNLNGPVYRRPSMWSRQLVSPSLRLGRRQFHSLLNDLTQRGFIQDITK